MAKVSAIILAAGLSQRMGEENKLFLHIKTKPIIKHVIDAIAKADMDEIIIVGSEYSNNFLKDLLDEKMSLVNNPNYKKGMTTSIKAGVRSAKKENAFMICLGDQPFIKSETYKKIAKYAENSFQESKSAIVKPSYQGKQGNPVVFSSNYLEDILNHEEPEGCKEIVEKNKAQLCLIEVNDEGILKDIDNKTDLSNSD